MFDDDGTGNLRIYSLVAGVRTYFDAKAGTVDYANGVIKINSILISSVSNVDGSASTRFRLTAIPDSNDVIPVRNQILEIDTANTTINGVIDATATTGKGYTVSTTGTTTTTTQPYAPAQPALDQILSEAGTIYGQGPAGTGYVAPSTQTIQGLAAQETMAKAANQQLMDTIQGKFSNPFLSPLIAQAGKDIYTNVAAEFSGAGRTPTSMGAQSAVIGQVADRALLAPKIQK